MIKLIIFDFDGTLVDSKEPVYISIKNCLDKMGVCAASDQLRKDIGKWPLEEHLIRLGVEKKDLDDVRSEVTLSFVANVDKVKPAPYLNSLKNIDIEKVILTNNEPDFVKSIMLTFHDNIFTEMHGPVKGKDKAWRIKQVIKKHKLKPSEVIYVGDKTTDISNAKKVKVWNVAVANKIAWDFTKDLIESEPDFIIDSLKGMGKVLEKLNLS